ncbi:hypothetical protein B0H14DRAFT_3483722 [Mycena olivaceomarginata]|nr:hypothetical protein B0H14DRAFT_3483722 [Mycena olivaceomarginata]
MTAKRYSTKESVSNVARLTLVFGHGVGGCTSLPRCRYLYLREQYKPPQQRVREAWALDRQNHGDAALLNCEELARSRPGGAIAAFVGSPRMQGQRIVPLAHSAGAISIVASTKFMSLPTTPYAGMILIEPSIIAPEVFHPLHRAESLSAHRRNSRAA